MFERKLASCSSLRVAITEGPSEAGVVGAKCQHFYFQYHALTPCGVAVPHDDRESRNDFGSRFAAAEKLIIV